MSRARQYDFKIGPLLGGFAFYPYQIAFGVTLRYWPDLFAPSVRIHLGPFKLYLAISFMYVISRSRVDGKGTK